MKTPNFAENAVYAKVKCFYGRRLTDKNYNDLLSLQGVNEIAEYLKANTAYSEIFEGISPTGELQRSRLENLLFNKLFNEFESIIRFQKAAGGEMYKYFIMKYDTAQIIKVLGSIETKSDDYFFTFPVFYNERSFLDLYSLSRAVNEDDLLEKTKGTVYYDSLRNALTDYRITRNLTVVQARLASMLDGEFIKLAGGKKNKLPEKSEIGNLYTAVRDIQIIKVMYRLLRFKTEVNDAAKRTYPVITSFSQRELYDMFRAPDKKSLDAIIENTHFADIVYRQSASDIFREADEYLMREMTKTVSRSCDPDSVMFAYFYTSENEIKNIIHIIEGVRYGLTPIEILPLLVGVSPSQKRSVINFGN